MSARLAERIASVPWLILEPAFQSLLEIASRETPDPDNLEAWKALLAPAPMAVDLRASSPLPGARRAQLRDGVAIIRISGPIFRHAGLFTELSGATALADVALDLGLARDDGRVKAILLAVDSPGGEATGVGDAAEAIRAAAAIKPVAAHVEGVAASAAFWLAAGASEIVAAPEAFVGSIGVVMRMTDTRERDARSGVRAHQFVSSQTPGKRPDPATDDGRRQIQRLVDSLAGEFVAAAARLRGMEEDALLAATHGGGLVIGREALASGLVDRLGSFEETLARLAAGAVPLAASNPSPGPRRLKENVTMTNPAPAPQAEAETQAPAPAPAAASQPAAPVAAAAEGGATDPQAAERARCAAILAAQKPGFQQLASLAIAQGWSPQVFAQAQDASAAAVAEATRAAQAQAFAASMPAPVAGAAEQPEASALPVEQRAKAEWDKDARLRAEFGNDFKSYLAFAKAQDGKVVKLISRPA
jgi:signal peptide peptidase SppA